MGGLGEAALLAGCFYYIPARLQPQSPAREPAFHIRHEQAVGRHYEADEALLRQHLARRDAAPERALRLRATAVLHLRERHSQKLRHGSPCSRLHTRLGPRSRSTGLARKPMLTRRHDDGIGALGAQAVVAQDAVIRIGKLVARQIGEIIERLDARLSE